MFYLELMLFWVIDAGFENTYTVSRKGKEHAGAVQDLIFCFCVWCKSRNFRRQGLSKIFSCNHSDGKLLLRPSTSYNRLLDKVASRILSNIHDRALLRKYSTTIVDVRLESKCAFDWKGDVNEGCRQTAVAWN